MYSFLHFTCFALVRQALNNYVRQTPQIIRGNRTPVSFWRTISAGHPTFVARIGLRIAISSRTIKPNSSGSTEACIDIVKTLRRFGMFFLRAMKMMVRSGSLFRTESLSSFFHLFRSLRLVHDNQAFDIRIIFLTSLQPDGPRTALFMCGEFLEINNGYLSPVIVMSTLAKKPFTMLELAPADHGQVR